MLAVAKFVAHVGATAYVGYGAIQTADAGSTGVSIDSFLQYGVLGLVVIGFLTEWIVPGASVKKLSAENQRLQALIEDKVLPVTSTYAATIERTTTALEKATEVMEASTKAEAARMAQAERQAGG